MRFPTLTFLLALYCGLANGCSEGVTRRTAATILSVKGNVVCGMAEKTEVGPLATMLEAFMKPLPHRQSSGESQKSRIAKLN
jgi:hypothetical protein